MEVTALLVFVGGFAVCAAMVFLVSIFGVKEQTFEEALEMQRKKNEKPKAKTKEKKKDGSAKRKKNKRKNSENVASEGKYEEAVKEPVYEEQENLPVSSEDEQIEAEEEHAHDTENQAAATEDYVQPTEEKTAEIIPTANEEVITAKEVETGASQEQEKEVADAVVEVVEVEESAKTPAVKIEASKTSPNPTKASKKNSKKQNMSKQGCTDLLTMVEKAVLNDAEAQQIVDVIFNKKGEGLSLGGGEGWVEKGKLSETGKLQKQLTDMELALQEEVARAQSFKDKMVELRREINEEKSAKAVLSRSNDEMKATRGQEVANLNLKLTEAQCDVTILQTQLNQQVQHQTQMEANHQHFQGTIDSLNLQLEMSNVAVTTASATAAAEREKCRAEVMKVENIRKELDQVMATKSQLNSEVARLQAENSGLMVEKENGKMMEKKLKEVEEMVVEREKEKAEIEMELEGKMKENVELERQLEEMKLKVESGSTAEEMVKGDLDVMTMRAEALEREIEELKLSQVGDCTMAELDVVTKKAGELEKEMESYKLIIANMTKDAEDKEKEGDEVNDASMDLLIRLFPNVDASASFEEIEAAIKHQLASSLESRQSEDTEKLESQVTHYKNALDQTEGMLTALQASVEDEEGKWKEKLQVVTEELERQKNSDDKSEENAENLDVKCQELETQLAQEKAEKLEALEKLATLKLELETSNGCETKEGLVSANIRLAHLLTVGQQALEKETQSVNALKSKLPLPVKSNGTAEIKELEN